eukprot:265191-Rhodomonas_salina.1
MRPPGLAALYSACRTLLYFSLAVTRSAPGAALPRFHIFKFVAFKQAQTRALIAGYDEHSLGPGLNLNCRPDPLQAASELAGHAVSWARWRVRREDWLEARLARRVDGSAVTEVRLFWGGSGPPKRYRLLALRDEGAGSEQAVVWRAVGGAGPGVRSGPEHVRVSGWSYDSFSLASAPLALGEGEVTLRVEVALEEVGEGREAEGVALAEMQVWAERKE